MKRNSNLAKHSNFLLHFKKEQEIIKNFKIRLYCTDAIQQTLWVQKMLNACAVKTSKTMRLIKPRIRESVADP